METPGNKYFLDEIGEKITYLPIISMEVKDNFLYVARSYHTENSFCLNLGNKRIYQIIDDTYVELEETPFLWNEMCRMEMGTVSMIRRLGV